jgi:hypothetical protein
MARRPNLVEVAPDVEPEHISGMEAGASSRCGDGTIKAQLRQVQAFDKRIDDADQGIWCDVVIDAGWKQVDLTAVGSFEKALEHLAGYALTRCRL